MITTAGVVRRGGATAARAFRPWVRSIAYDNRRKRSRGWRRSTPRGCGGKGCGGWGKSTTTGGGGDRLSRGKVMPRVSGLLITGDQRVKVL
jgi:hypothetical protein